MKRLCLFVAALVLATLPAAAQRTSVGRDFPVYLNAGKPDLTIDPQRFVSQMEIVDRLFDPVKDQCAFEEGVIRAAGYRRLLRFDTVIMNGGDGDLVIGDRSDPNNPYAQYFEYSPCHGHYHIHGFSEYLLLDANGATVLAGHKQGFCLTDSGEDGDTKSHGYDCQYQGVTSGWGDWYYKQLVGQWIDITGVPEGDYIVRVNINGAGASTPIFDEGSNRYPNRIDAKIHVPNPRNKVAIVP
jgi:lysyl oxidase